jgi:hypothetical protein
VLSVGLKIFPTCANYRFTGRKTSVDTSSKRMFTLGSKGCVLVQRWTNLEHVNGGDASHNADSAFSSISVDWTWHLLESCVSEPNHQPQ